MKQPELGKLLSEARVSNGLTQLELAEACQVDIRTIQRIETGEVTPRLYTLRKINEFLGTDVDLNGIVERDLPPGFSRILKIGWISGIVMYCFIPLLLVEIIGITQDLFSVTEWPSNVVVLYSIVHLIFIFLFYRSLFYLGKFEKNGLLIAGAVASILLYMAMNTTKVLGIGFEMDLPRFTPLILGSLLGVATVILGIGFVMTTTLNRKLAMVVGIILIFAGLSFLHSSIVGFLVSSVSLILQIIYLIWLQKYIGKTT